MTSWQLQEAKARLSELMRLAETEGPQEITLHGRPAVVVMSSEDFSKLSGGSGKSTLVEFMANSPLKGLDIEFTREDSMPRDEDLFGDTE